MPMDSFYFYAREKQLSMRVTIGGARGGLSWLRLEDMLTKEDQGTGSSSLIYQTFLHVSAEKEQP